MTDEAAPPAVLPKNLTLEKASIDFRSSQTQVVLGAVAVVLLSLVLYGPLMLQQFPGTDNNPALHAISALNGDASQFLGDIGGRAEDAGFGYRPLFYLLILCEAFLFRGTAFGYHLVNVILLIACC